MKFLICTLACLGCAIYALSGQSLTPQLLSSAGGDFNNAQMRLEWSLGELAVTTIGNSSKLTQGFHQGDLKVSTSVISPEFADINVFPNPVSDVLNIDIQRPLSVRLELYNATGSLVQEREENGPLMEIDVHDVAPGLYFLRVSHEKEVLAVLKIEKFDF